MTFSLSKIFDSFVLLVKGSYEKLELLTEGRRNKKALWSFCLLLVFSLILLLNILTPYIADDFVYQLIFGTKEYVTNVGDIFESQLNHYDKWGGRSVVHFIAQVLLLLPPFLADVLNSMAYLLFVYLIYLHIIGKKGRHSLSLFVLINLAAWFFMPMFGDTVLWITGSANYLWGTTILLLFLLPYRFYNGVVNDKKKAFVTIVMLLAGVIAGWTNENTVAGMIVIILLLFLYYRSQGWKIPLAYIVGLLGVVIGYSLMILAPGNFKRGGEAIGLDLFVILYRFVTYTQSLFVEYGYLLMIYVLLAVIMDRLPKKEASVKISYLSYIYLIGGLIAIYAMLLSPQFPLRAWFGLITFFLIALGMLFYRITAQESAFKVIRGTLILLGSVIFLFSFTLASKDIYRMYRIDKERILLVEEAKKNKLKECVFYMNRPQTRYLHAEDIDGNHLLVHHYGIHIEYK